MFIDTKQKQLYPERVSGNTFDELTYGEIVCFWRIQMVINGWLTVEKV